MNPISGNQSMYVFPPLRPPSFPPPGPELVQPRPPGEGASVSLPPIREVFPSVQGSPYSPAAPAQGSGGHPAAFGYGHVPVPDPVQGAAPGGPRGWDSGTSSSGSSDISMSPPPSPNRSLPPQEAATQYLEGLVRHPNGDFYLPDSVQGTKPMSDRQRQAISQYEASHANLNPGGDIEIGQVFRETSDGLGRTRVVPSGPPVVGRNHDVEIPLADLEQPGTFTVFHNHNDRNRPGGPYFDSSYNLPSVTDQLSTRLDVLAGRIRYGMVREPEGTYLSFDGGVPVRAYRLEDRGPGFRTPPRSPGID